MATRGERQRYEDERHNPPRPARPETGPKRRPTADKGARNLSKHGGKNAVYVTEETYGKRPTRKSTRKGPMKNSRHLERLASKP